MKLHTASLGRQQELLLEKIEMFDHTNHNLRELLREWSEHEVLEENSTSTYSKSLLTVFLHAVLLYGQRESLVWSEQKDALKIRLADTEAENIVSINQQVTYSVVFPFTDHVTLCESCLSATFSQIHRQRERGLQACRAFGF